MAAHARTAPKLLLLTLSLLGAATGGPTAAPVAGSSCSTYIPVAPVALEYQAIQRWPVLSSASFGE